MDADLQLPLSNPEAPGFITKIARVPAAIPGGCMWAASFLPEAFSESCLDRMDPQAGRDLCRSTRARKAEYTAGRMLAGFCLEQLGYSVGRIPSGRHGQPEWPCGTTGSLSHTRDRAVCAMSSDRDLLLGVDIEEICDEETASDVCPLVAQAEEERIIKAGARHTEGLTLLFSAKECLFKALFPRIGRHFGFDAARLVYFDPAEFMILELVTGLSERFPAGRTFRVLHRRGRRRVLTLLAAR